MTPPLTTATVSALLERLEKTTTEGFADIKSQLEHFVLKELYASELGAMDRRVRTLESALRWVVTTIVGLVVIAVVAGVIKSNPGVLP